MSGNFLGIDEFGNLNNWWSTEEEERFNEHAQKMINQLVREEIL